jgi:hypothetical protein
MLLCKNVMFKKFLFFSFVFLIFSMLTCTVMSYAAQMPVKKPAIIKQTSQIQIQQRTILDRLGRMEEKLSYSAGE